MLVYHGSTGNSFFLQLMHIVTLTSTRDFARGASAWAHAWNRARTNPRHTIAFQCMQHNYVLYYVLCQKP